MLRSNGTPFGFSLNFANDSNFNFAVDSVFSKSGAHGGGFPANAFLLLDNTPMLLLDGEFLLLL